MASTTCAWGAAAGASTTTAPAAPQSDPFYTPPARYTATAPGTILRSRPVQIATLATVPMNV
jgi:hypothetical protein